MSDLFEPLMMPRTRRCQAVSPNTETSTHVQILCEEFIASSKAASPKRKSEHAIVRLGIDFH